MISRAFFPREYHCLAFQITTIIPLYFPDNHCVLNSSSCNMIQVSKSSINKIYTSIAELEPNKLYKIDKFPPTILQTFPNLFIGLVIS
jgi:hypothetical protein